MEKFKSVDDYIAQETRWADELQSLRKILNATELEEGVKWGAPCYMIDGQNVVGMMAFKDYFGLWFHQGVFLKDKDKVLMNAQEGKTKALRQWRMTSADAINADQVLAYVNEAIANARSGKKVPAARAKPLNMPNELKQALRNDNAAADAFETFIPGKQREFADYISDAKQITTKLRRVDKILPMIKAGTGLNDKYK
jgi:uncharacterized protein YdeI (YjbR/CyaY-like superfamily)